MKEGGKEIRAQEPAMWVFQVERGEGKGYVKPAIGDGRVLYSKWRSYLSGKI